MAGSSSRTEFTDNVTELLNMLWRHARSGCQISTMCDEAFHISDEDRLILLFTTPSSFQQDIVPFRGWTAVPTSSSVAGLHVYISLHYLLHLCDRIVAKEAQPMLR